MVKIEEMSPEEIARRERFSKLMEITKDFVGEKRLITSAVSVNVYDTPDREKRVYNVPFIAVERRIVLDDNEFEGEAVELAGLYEQAFEGEWVVVRNYSPAESQ